MDEMISLTVANKNNKSEMWLIFCHRNIGQGRNIYQLNEEETEIFKETNKKQLNETVLMTLRFFYLNNYSYFTFLKFNLF